MKLTVKSIEKKLKALAAAQNAARTKYLRKTAGQRLAAATSYNRETPIDWRTVLALDWQVKNHVFKGCNGKAMFDPVKCEATSYGWWYFVKRIGGKVVFNSYKYSVTTGQHQWSMRSLLKSLGVRIDLDVECADGLQAFQSQALPGLYARLYDLEIREKRRNAADYSQEIKRVKSRIALARKLGAKCPRDEMDKIRSRAMDAEASRLADMRAKREAERTLRAASKTMTELNQVPDLSQLVA